MAGQYDRIVPPGGSGKIPVTVSTGRSGHLKKSVLIYTNAPEPKGAVRVTIHGEVWQPVETRPASVSFGRLKPKQAHHPALVRRVMIVNHTKEKADITNVRSSDPVFSAELTTLQEGKKFQLTVRVDSALAPGLNKGKIKMSTGVSEMPALSIPVNVYVMSEVDIQPSTVLLRPRRAQPTQRRFRIQNNADPPLKIRAVRASDSTLKVAYRETLPGRLFTVTVDVPAQYTIPPGGDSITIETSNPKFAELIVPVRASGTHVSSRVRRTTAHDAQALPKPGAASAPTASSPKGGRAASGKSKNTDVEPKKGYPDQP